PVLATVLAVGWLGFTIVVLPSAVMPGPWQVFVNEFASGLLFGLVFGLVFWLVVRRRRSLPQRAGPLRWHGLFRRDALLRGLASGLIVGVVVRLAGPGGYRSAVSLTVAALVGLVAGVVVGISGPGTDEASSTVPLTSWRNDLAFGLMMGAAAGLGTGLGV